MEDQERRLEEELRADAREKAERVVARATADAATEQQTVPVLTRFEQRELDAMKEETGARGNGTAVACFVRKNLNKKG